MKAGRWEGEKYIPISADTTKTIMPNTPAVKESAEFMMLPSGVKVSRAAYEKQYGTKIAERDMGKNKKADGGELLGLRDIKTNDLELASKTGGFMLNDKSGVLTKSNFINASKFGNGGKTKSKPTTTQNPLNTLAKGMIAQYPDRYSKFNTNQFSAMMDSIAQVESRNRNIKQEEGGRGRGYYQMEGETLPTAINRYNNYKKIIKEQDINLPVIKKPASNDAR